MLIMKPLAFSTILLVLSINAHGASIILHNATDLINLSNNVSSGSTYSGTTILLDADIDFDGLSDIFEPIGKNRSHYFTGTFDGQGHMIKSLAMNSSLVYTGFFGCTKNATFKNIVFDSSCSFLSRNSSYNNFVTLGPISYFTFSGEEYGIENIVNMASITFTGLNVNYIDAGGITGKMNSNSFIRNCINYGNVTIIGSSTNLYVGGIVGEFIADANKGFSLQNCINYGYISNSISGSSVFIGGIVGYTEKSFLIDSCVGAGEISSPSSSKVGGIIGTTYDSSTSKCIMNNSYWTSNISGYNRQYNNGGYLSQTDFEYVEELNETVLGKLNGGGSGYDNAIWLLNSKGCTVTFFVNNKVYLSSTSPMILMPSFGKDNLDGWYTDRACTTLLASLTVTSDANFYGIYKTRITVTFDANGGNLSESVSSSITVIYSEEYGGLPGVTRTGYGFDGWFTAPVGASKITAYSIVTDSESHTLYAHWTPNNYTVTFDFANGTTLNYSFGYNQPIEYPENEVLIRDGYIFIGWDKEIDFMPAQNITTTAYWTEIVQSSSSSSSTVNHIESSSSSSSVVNSIESSSSSSSSGTLVNPIDSSSNSNLVNHVDSISSSSTINHVGSSSSSIINHIDSSSNNNLVNHIESSSSSVITDSSKVGYEYVEIVFGNKDLSKEDVERIVQACTDDSFTIERIETNDDSTVRVIIKFTDVEKAESFIETIKKASDSNINIVSVGYFLPKVSTFSPSIMPFISTFLILLCFMY